MTCAVHYPAYLTLGLTTPPYLQLTRPVKVPPVRNIKHRPLLDASIRVEPCDSEQNLAAVRLLLIAAVEGVQVLDSVLFRAHDGRMRLGHPVVVALQVRAWQRLLLHRVRREDEAVNEVQDWREEGGVERVLEHFERECAVRGGCSGLIARRLSSCEWDDDGHQVE